VDIFVIAAPTADAAPFANSLLKLLLASQWNARGVSNLWSGIIGTGILVFYNCRNFLRFLFTQKHPLFLQKCRTFSSSKRTSSALFFSGNIDVFRGTETNLESSSYAVGARGAREKHHVFSGTFGTQIKARPSPAACDEGSGSKNKSRRCRPH